MLHHTTLECPRLTTTDVQLAESNMSCCLFNLQQKGHKDTIVTRKQLVGRTTNEVNMKNGFAMMAMLLLIIVTMANAIIA